MSARAFFDAIARRYDRDYALGGAVSRARMAAVLAAIGEKRRVLSLGIGTGRELPALLDAGHDVRGMDVSTEMIAVCNRRSRTVPIVVGDFFEGLPFEAGAFDAVLALHGTLAHPPHEGALGALATEIARVLVPAGVFVAEVPARAAVAALSATAPESFTAVGDGRFVHRDAVARVAIEGVALDAEGWVSALAPLAITATPLGATEHFLVGRVVR